MERFFSWVLLLPLSLLTAIVYCLLELCYSTRELLYRLYNWTYDTDYYDNYNRLKRKLEKNNNKEQE